MTLVTALMLAVYGATGSETRAIPPPSTPPTPTTTEPPPPGPVTTGTVVDATGAPLANAHLERFVVGSTASDTTTTGVDGRFTFPPFEHISDPTHELRLTAYAPGNRPTLLPQTISLGTPEGGLLSDVEIVLGTESSLTVNVTAGGQPATAWVYLERGSSPHGVGIDGPVVDGTAQFNALPLDDYRIFVEARLPGYSSEWHPSTPYRSRATVLEATGGNHIIDVELEAAAWITGRVFLDDGEPAQNAGATNPAVMAGLFDAHADDHATPCYGDASNEPVGTYLIGCLHPNGAYTVQSTWWSDDGGTAEVLTFPYPIEVDEGQTFTGVDFHYGIAPSIVPVVPARLADGRPNGVTVDGILQATGELPADTTLTVPIAGRHTIPDTATAAIINLTAVLPHAPGHLTAWPCNEPRPNTSNVNYTTGQVIPNAATVKLDPDGNICIHTHATTHLIVDITAYTST